MTRIFSPAVDFNSRALRKTSAPGDPEGWEALGEGYTELASSIGASVKVNVMTKTRVPGVSAYDPTTGEIYIDSEVLGVNPFMLDMNVTSQQAALISFHGLFLHDLAHARFSNWKHDFEPGKDVLASSLEDLRAEYRLVASRPSSRQWLRAALAERVDHALREIKDPALRTVTLGVETVGRALLGLIEVKDVSDILAKVSDLLDDRGLALMHDVVVALKLVGDTDRAQMVSLVERLWVLVEPPENEDNEEESDSSEDASGSDNSDDSDSDGGGSEGDSEGDSEGEGSEGEGQPGQAEGMSPSEASSMASKIRQASDAATNELRNEKLEELIEQVEEAVGKDLSDSSEADEESDSNSEGEGEADSDDETDDGDISHAHSFGNRSITVKARKPKVQELALRRRLADRLRKAQWRDREIIKFASELPPGRLNTREAIRAEAQKQRGQMVTAKPWKSRRHRTTETKKVRVGVLIDASGSMSPYIKDFSSAAWTTISAVRDVGGRSIGVAFGDTAAIIDPLAARPSPMVPTYPADGGMEAISEALDIAIEELDLFDKDGKTGPRLLVIFSDGYWTPEQTAAADYKLEKLRQAGVGVVVVAAGGFVESHPHDELMALESSADFNHELGDIMVKAVKTA